MTFLRRHAVTFPMVLGIVTSGVAAGEAFARAPRPAALPPLAAPANPGIDLAAADVDFSAIVALNNCSAALVRFTSSRPDDKALVLTNGHCYEGGFLEPGEVIVDEASSRAVRILTPDGRGTLANLRAERLVYATMTDTDFALYRLPDTYAALERRHGVEALTMSEERPREGDAIRVVSGYWKRIYACAVEAFVPALREGEWTFRDSIKYTEPGCDTIGGTSGSPIVDAATRRVVGVNNTGNESGRRCTVNNPCEVDAEGRVTVDEGASYGQQTFQVYSCLGADNGLDLRKPGCALPKP